MKLGVDVIMKNLSWHVVNSKQKLRKKKKRIQKTCCHNLIESPIIDAIYTRNVAECYMIYIRASTNMFSDFSVNASFIVN